MHFMYMYTIHDKYYIHTLQISEMYSSGGELHIELMTGQPQGSKSLWVSGLTHCMSLHLWYMLVLHTTRVQ